MSLVGMEVQSWNALAGQIYLYISIYRAGICHVSVCHISIKCRSYVYHMSVSLSVSVCLPVCLSVMLWSVNLVIKWFPWQPSSSEFLREHTATVRKQINTHFPNYVKTKWQTMETVSGVKCLFLFFFFLLQYSVFLI